jgi:hypothetical protein
MTNKISGMNHVIGASPQHGLLCCQADVGCRAEAERVGAETQNRCCKTVSVTTLRCRCRGLVAVCFVSAHAVSALGQWQQCPCTTNHA